MVDKADAVYFAGGDQANYVIWKGSALIDAVKRVYARGGVVGGGSAGLAIQGAVVYDSVAGDRLNVETHTKDAVNNPLEPRISFTTGLLRVAGTRRYHHRHPLSHARPYRPHDRLSGAHPARQRPSRGARSLRAGH